MQSDRPSCGRARGTRTTSRSCPRGQRVPDRPPGSAGSSALPTGPSSDTAHGVPKLVVHGAKLKCSEGVSPGTLSVTGSGPKDNDHPTATVEDYKPMSNIGAFGMCRSTSNPQVSAATSAAQGVLTPQPCTPVVTSAWSPGASVITIDEHKALSSDSTCSCSWNGTIEITDPASEIDIE